MKITTVRMCMTNISLHSSTVQVAWSTRGEQPHQQTHSFMKPSIAGLPEELNLHPRQTAGMTKDLRSSTTMGLMMQVHLIFRTPPFCCAHVILGNAILLPIPIATAVDSGGAWHPCSVLRSLILLWRIFMKSIEVSHHPARC